VRNWKSKKKEKEGTEIVGNIIHCKLKKSRQTVENKMVDVLLRYDSGLNRYYGLVDLATETGVLKKVGPRIELSDGRKIYKKHIEENPTEYFTEDLLGSIEDAAKEVFCYGSATDVVADGVETATTTESE
jgi:hypothetical protein